MTVTNLNSKKIENTGLNSDYEFNDTLGDDWVRNPSWLAMPNVQDGEKVAALVAIDPGETYVNLVLRLHEASSIIPATCTVDWGDGTVETFDPQGTGNFFPEHVYQSSNSAFDDTNAPATIGTNTINRSSHGYPSGYKITLNDVVGPTNISEYKEYYIVNPTTDTFQISEEKNGTPITFDSTGTTNLLPYKQAVILVTFNGLCSYFYFNPFTLPNEISSSDAHMYAYLDIHVNLSIVSIFRLYDSSGTQIDRYGRADRLETFSGFNLGISELNYMFTGCRSLRSVPVLNIPSSTYSLNSLFAYCTSLTHPPENLNTSHITDVNYMFLGCYSLKNIPKYDFSSVGDAVSTFEQCYNIICAPNLDLSNASRIYSLFSNCYNLERVDVKFNKKLSYANRLFNSCHALKEIPSTFVFENLQNATQLFYDCHNLRFERNFVINAPKLGNAINMFYSCYGLENIEIHAPNLVDAHSMFERCYYLKNVTGSPMHNLARTHEMFSHCHALKRIDIDMSNSAPLSAQSMFYVCRSLAQVPAFDTTRCTNFVNTFRECLSLTSLSDSYDFTSGKIITTSHMFYDCRSLESVPDMDLSNCANVEHMFYRCFSLKRYPRLMDLSSLTYPDMENLFRENYCMRVAPKIILPTSLSNITARYMFYYCPALEYIPKIENFHNVNDIRDIFYVNRSLKEVPELDLSGVTLINNHTFGNNMSSIIKCKVTGLTQNFYIPFGKLDANELNNVFTNLPDLTGATGRTITISNQWGHDDPAVNTSIATNKNWTVSG